jgi:hypothetical protein
MRLEQAIFTSIRSPRLDGYQLAAVSSGISERVARELSVWGPAHDSLRSQNPGATSVNFHPLPDELHCLSKTTLSGSEYSGRGGGRVYTQMLILPREALTRFACDPWLILQAVEASGRLIVYDAIPRVLQPVPLLGRAKISAARLEAVATEIGAECLAELAAALLDSTPVSVITNISAERLIQAALHQLSERERLDASFTTGLRHSTRRPFRLSILPDDPALMRESQRAGSKVIEALAAAPV